MKRSNHEDYCQYLLSCQDNYTLMHYAEHMEGLNHNAIKPVYVATCNHRRPGSQSSGWRAHADCNWGRREAGRKTRGFLPGIRCRTVERFSSSRQAGNPVKVSEFVNLNPERVSCRYSPPKGTPRCGGLNFRCQWQQRSGGVCSRVALR
jgi:hypothetical protein